MAATHQTPQRVDSPPFSSRMPQTAPLGFQVSINQKVIYLAGAVRDKTEADDLIATIEALKARLPEAPPAKPLADDQPEEMRRDWGG